MKRTRINRIKRKMLIAIFLFLIFLMGVLVGHAIGTYQGQRKGGIFLDNTVYTGTGERATPL